MPAPSPKRPRSLIELLRKRIIDAIGIVAGPGTWCVVVADRPSLSIVSTVLKMHAIMEHNVVAVQLLSRSRQPYPEMDAVYILVPTADSVARAVEDFSPAPGAGRPRARKYARAHLLFTGALPEPLLARLRSSPAAPYIRTVSELFIEYNPIESRVFLTTPSEHPFHALYSPHALHAMAADLDSAADRVLSAVVSLGIRPHIRYYRPPPAAAAYEAPPGAMPAMGRAPACPRIAEAMAARIQAKLDEHQAREQSGRERPMEGPFPSVIIVLDRSVDMYAPLLHEFTYQAIVHDLIDLEGGTKYAYDITTAAGQPRHIEAELSEQSDLLWEKYRHWHISDLSQRLADKFEELVEGNASIRAAVDGSRLSVGQMREVLAELPDFKRLQDSYSLHIDLASKCLEIINRGGLTVLSDFEQDLIAGKSAWGEPVDQESLEARLIALLDDRTLDSSDRVRILFLYLVHIGGGSALDRRRLSEVPQCLTINDKRAAVNLRRLGVRTDKGDDEAAMGPEPDRYSWNSTAPTSTAEKRSLLEPAVKHILRDHLSGRLDPKLFPWTAEPPAAEAAAEAEEATRWSPSLNVRSLRRDRGTLRNRKPRHKFGGSTGGVVIVYIAGGVTFAEMRSVYELAESLGREIYIGSTHVITPRGFLDDMKSLHLELLQ